MTETCIKARDGDGVRLFFALHQQAHVERDGRIVVIPALRIRRGDKIADCCYRAADAGGNVKYHRAGGGH